MKDFSDQTYFLFTDIQQNAKLLDGNVFVQFTYRKQVMFNNCTIQYCWTYYMKKYFFKIENNVYHITYYLKYWMTPLY